MRIVLFLPAGKPRSAAATTQPPSRVGTSRTSPLRRVVRALAEGDVDRAVGRVDPAVGDEQERPVPGHVVAELDLDPVVARHPLVGAPAEGVEVAAVAGADDLGHVAARVVAGARRRGGAGRSGGQPGGGGSRANRSSTKTSVPVGWSTTISETWSKKWVSQSSAVMRTS